MKKIGILIMMTLILLLTSCSSNETVEKYSYEEIKEMIESEEALAVDVRTADEFDSGHLYNAYNHPLNYIQDGDFGDLNDKDAILFIYCRSGNRSNTAYQIFVDNGYTNVYDIGGIIDWPYEVYE